MRHVIFNFLQNIYFISCNPFQYLNIDFQENYYNLVLKILPNYWKNKKQNLVLLTNSSHISILIYNAIYWWLCATPLRKSTKFE